MTETHHIEFKQQLTKGLEKEVVAFLNYKSGGVIYIGINDKGKAVGLKDADKDALKVKDRIKKNISPFVMGLFDVLIEEKNGKDIVKVILASGPEKPYYIKQYGMTPKGCYYRIGTAAEPMPQTMIDDMYARRTRQALVKIKSTKQRLQFSELKIYYTERGKPLNDQFAHNLELLDERDTYNYNAYLLSDINTTSFKLAKYAGTDRRQLIENEEYGNRCIITAAKKVLDKLDIENRTISTITANDRTDKRLWNAESLREAVRNAFVHNDYSTETFPKFELFSDRIEITTYGGLPLGMSKPEFFSGYSVPRNKVLMRVFRDLGLVENLGYGIPKILEFYDESCFEFSEHFLRMRFPIERTQNSKITDKASTTSLEFVVGYERLTQRQKDVLELISQNNKITYSAMETILNISTSAIRKHTDKLKEYGAVSRDGTFEGNWVIHFKDQ